MYHPYSKISVAKILLVSKSLLFRGCIFSLLFLMFTNSVFGGVVLDNLEELRDQTLYYSIGFAPNDSNTITIRHGLFAQSPFSFCGPPTNKIPEIDLAASGFSLAALPIAVEENIVNKQQAFDIALDAAKQIRKMIEKSKMASSTATIDKYGYEGVLFHYNCWDEIAGEFQGKPGTEISSIDTALLMFGLMVSANYFQGDVLNEYIAARNMINWKAWLDMSTPDHEYQFRIAYYPGEGFTGWWDVYTQEVMLLSLFAAMSDPTIDLVKVWRAWERTEAEYGGYRCIATYHGDPFTLIYGLAFLDLELLGTDIDGIDWFEEGRKCYMGHVKFFKNERGYLDKLTFAAFGGSFERIALPKIGPGDPITRTDATVYSAAGGLLYFDENISTDLESNMLAHTLSGLIDNTDDFFGWHGWPAATVDATDPTHPVTDGRIIGQDISLIAIAIDNWLSHRIHDLVLGDPDFQLVLLDIFTPITYIVTPVAGTGGSVSPDQRVVPTGATAQFTVTPDSGYVRDDTVGGSCPQGGWNGDTWTTGANEADCTVSFSFNSLPEFDDVPASHWAWRQIMALAGAGVTTGCAPNLYCPENPVTRDQMAVFLLRGIHGGEYTPPPATGTKFKDVPQSHWASDWIEQLAAEGVTKGCGGGNYCPNNSVTRAEMAIFLLRSKHGSAYQPPPATGTRFKDVPRSHWAADWIEQLAAEAITGGCGNGNYCPDSSVTRAQMAVFIARTFYLPLP